jgi:HAE1 family hydrophobic/amphiphilic exporter-1
MSIYKSSVNRPITTLMIFGGIIIIGLYGLSRLPIDLYPEMELPAISVMTTYPGANAADIETNVTRKLEDAFNSIDKLKDITSISSDNLSVIFLEFEWGTNLDEASNDIRSYMDLTFDALPEDCDRPSVFKFNTSMMPILFYAVTAEENYSGLEKILDERIINPLNRIEGIGSINLVGAPVRKIYVDVDPKRLDAYNLTIEQVGGIIAAENLDMPSGNVKMGQMDYQLRIPGEFIESDQLKSIVVGNFGGNPIYLNDIGTVRDTIKDISIQEKINGRQGMRMFIMKQSGANTVQITREVNKQLKELTKSLPPDVTISPIFDTSEFIIDAIRNLSETLMWAFLFVVLVVLAFLGQWRATFIVLLAIPISLITGFVYLYFTGNSLNVISLASLAIAIGMVVDDAIVVLENISKHIDRGASPREAAIYATNEVWLAVIVTTLVVLAVFLPLTLVTGLTGVMFKQLGWIVSITILTSMVIAISLTPMLASRLLRMKDDKKRVAAEAYSRTIGKFLEKTEVFYENNLRWALRHRGFVIISGLVLFITSLFLLKFIGTDFMPESDESQLSVYVELQSGIRMEETALTTLKIENIIKEGYPEVQLVSSSTGSDDEGGFISMFTQSGSNIVNFTLKLCSPDDRKRTVWDISDDLRAQLEQIPEIINFNLNTQSHFMGTGGNQVDVEIYGYDFDTTNQVAEQFRSAFRNIPGAEDIQISREKEKPELQIILDRDKLSQHGLSTATVSMYTRNRVDGLIASRFREEGDEYDIIVRLKEEYRNSISDIEEITIMTPMGKKVKIAELGEVKEYWSPPNIERKRRERLVTVSVKPVGISLGELANRINGEISKLQVPPDVMVLVGGAYEDQQESFADLGLLMLISLILVYLVMASQFESFTMPFIIMFTIPFAMTGVLFALFITGTTLSVIAALGAVLLVGIVTKNGIVLIDFINLMRDREYKLVDAIALSGRSRLRPVLMTSFTTILAMVPLAISKGEGSALWAPMGVTVIGGLVFSTFLTLIYIPVLYGTIIRKDAKALRQNIWSKFRFMNNNKENDKV